jgi:hypothetical protein
VAEREREREREREGEREKEGADLSQHVHESDVIFLNSSVSSKDGIFFNGFAVSTRPTKNFVMENSSKRKLVCEN